MARPSGQAAYRRDQADQLIRAHMPLVRRMAGHLASRLPPSVELDDLMQFGLIGLNDALQRYEAQDGVPFEVYARTRIRGAMIDGLRQADLLPRHVRDRVREAEETVRRLSHALGRPPEDSEIAAAMDLSLEDYRTLLQDAVSIQYGDGSDEEHGGSRAEEVPDEDTPLDLIERRDDLRKLTELLKRLPEKEGLILALHYQEGLTFREVAKVLDLTPGRISQLHTQAVVRLRSMAKEDGFA